MPRSPRFVPPYKARRKAAEAMRMQLWRAPSREARLQAYRVALGRALNGPR